MLHDLRFGLKLLVKEKAFTITALLTLALCIGANTSIFTVLNSVILEPMPFPESERLVTMYNIYPGVGVDRGANGIPDYLDRRQLTDVFESVALFGNSGYDVGAEGSPVRIDGEYVTPSYFHALRGKPVLGRTFVEEDAVYGKDKFAILSYAFWRDMFARDPNTIGKEIRLSGVQYRIVGIMPENFGQLRRETKLWVPFSFEPRQTSDDARHSNNWSMIARLKPEITTSYAQQRIDALNRVNLERFPKYRKLLENARFGTRVVNLKDEYIRDIRPTLYLLQGAVVLVLLIGCVNVANLMLVRSNVRLKEMAIRSSLGAGRLRLGRQLLTESVLVAILGGALGLMVGLSGIDLLLWLGGEDLPRAASVRIDGSVLMISAAVTVLTGLIFGSVPLIHLLRRDLNEVFRGAGQTRTAERGALWTRSALVVCQISLAFVLLIGSGLLTVSFAKLLSVDPGFRTENVMTARLSLPRARYADDALARNFISVLLDRIGPLPGVAAAGVTTFLPFGRESNASVIDIVGYVRGPGENPPVPAWNYVDPGYFQTMKIPLIEGRLFTKADSADSLRVGVIDQFLARKYWPKGSPIGAKIRRGIDDDAPIITVVGVVGNVKVADLAEHNPVGQVYYPYTQFVPRNMHLVVRSERPEPNLTAAIRSQLRDVDAELPVFDAKMMPERVASSLVNRRAAMILCLVFAGLAVVLSAIGIYGVLSYSVTQRIREFGIRVALGAGIKDVVGMVLHQGLKLAAIGLAIGLAVALAVSRLLTTMLYGVKPADPLVFLSVAVILALIALIASLIPSLRALRIRPAVALRCD